jgi:hypothetical protein
VDDNDEFFEYINLMEAIKKALRKENRELIELARCEPNKGEQSKV